MERRCRWKADPVAYPDRPWGMGRVFAGETQSVAGLRTGEQKGRSQVQKQLASAFAFAAGAEAEDAAVVAVAVVGDEAAGFAAD